MTTRMRRAQPHAKTSSERGRRFRARQREREAWLVKYVLQVGEEIQSLSRSRQLQYEQSLRTRHSAEGSCVRAIREFFSLFRDGLESDEIPANQPFLAEHVRFKERYMRYVYDPDTITGDLRGVDAAIDQWRRYTVVHDRFHLDLGHIETLGPLDDPTFHLHHKLTVRISRATFQHMFPSCVDDEELVSKFLHRLVTYDSVAYFRFSDEGRINYYGVQVDFVNGLMRAGGSLRDVSSMLQCAMITPLCTIRDGGQCRQESAVIESEEGDNC